MSTFNQFLITDVRILSIWDLHSDSMAIFCYCVQIICCILLYDGHGRERHEE